MRHLNFMSINALVLLLLLPSGLACQDTDAPWSAKIADSFINRHPGGVTYDSGSPSQKWNYEQGLMLSAIYKKWKESGDKKYFQFVEDNLDKYLSEDGDIRTYSVEEYNLDHLSGGKVLLDMHEATGKNKYKLAAGLLRSQLNGQPRNSVGGFWHKKIYPHQMWLDGLFMAEPFYLRYSLMSGDSAAVGDIARQFTLIYSRCLDPKTGLLYHGWDESKEQKWADPATGCSPNFWGRSIGWYMMGLVDVLDYYPAGGPERKELIDILKSVSDAVLKFRDGKKNLWHQVLDQGDREGNYLESSASCMFAYAFAKGANKKYLDDKFFNEGKKTFDAVVENFITAGKDGMFDFGGTCRSAGLGGKPYRDGSYQYYISEPIRLNDMKGVGAFILLALEIEKSKETIK